MSGHSSRRTAGVLRVRDCGRGGRRPPEQVSDREPYDQADGRHRVNLLVLPSHSRSLIECFVRHVSRTPGTQVAQAEVKVPSRELIAPPFVTGKTKGPERLRQHPSSQQTVIQVTRKRLWPSCSLAEYSQQEYPAEPPS